LLRKFLALCPLIQEKNYNERVMLIYDGLHYDALAVSFLGGILLFDKAQEIFANCIYLLWGKNPDVSS